jgi:hypothetical protein
MQELVKVWQSIPAEARGAFWLWLGSAALAGARWVAGKYVPAGNLRSTLDAIDLIAHVVTASSRRLGDRPAPAPKRPSVP